MTSFLNFLKKNFPQYYALLAGKTPGTTAFNNAWKMLANRYGNMFGEAQRLFIQQTHYEPAAQMIKEATGLDVKTRSRAVQEVVWSTAVQHGAAGARNVFRNAGIRPGMSDREIIERVYNERMANNGLKYFSSSSPSVRQAVVNRFMREKQDALRMLG